MDFDTKLNARRLAEQARRIPNLFESDIHYMVNGPGTLALYLETQALGDLCLPEGEYLSTSRMVHTDEELEQAIEQFYGYAAAQSFVLVGPLILIERSYLSLFNHNKLHYELQALIEPDGNFEKGSRP